MRSSQILDIYFKECTVNTFFLFVCLFGFLLINLYNGRKESRLIPRFSARASIGMNLPLAEMVKTARGIRRWGLG